jgi:hypothetical protein
MLAQFTNVHEVHLHGYQRSNIVRKAELELFRQPFRKCLSLWTTNEPFESKELAISAHNSQKAQTSKYRAIQKRIAIKTCRDISPNDCRKGRRRASPVWHWRAVG